MRNSRGERRPIEEKARQGRRTHPRGRGANPPRATASRAQTRETCSRRLAWFSLGVVLAATALTLWGVTRCEYQAWDRADFMDRSPFGRYGVLKSLGLIATGRAYRDRADYAVSQASWAFDILLFRRNPFLSHLLNLVLHLANVALLWHCIRLLLRRASPLAPRGILLAATAGAALFGVHPVNVEPVAWVGGRKVELAFLFSLSAFLFLLSPRGGRGRYALALLSYALAAFSNAAAFGLALVFAAWWLIVARAGPRRTVLLALPFLALAAWSGALRFRKHTPEQDVVSARETWSAQIGVAFSARAHETLDLVFPKGLASVYPLTKGPFWTRASFAGVLLAAASGLAVVLGWRKCVASGPGRVDEVDNVDGADRTDRSMKESFFLPTAYCPLPTLLAFGLAWYWASLLPAFAHHHSQADRHLYCSAPGLFMTLGILFALAFGRLGAFGRAALAIAGCAAGLALAVVAARQTTYWTNTKSAYARAVSVTKDNHVAQVNLGYALAEEKNYEAAMPLYRAALDFFPEFAEAHYFLGISLFETGRREEALEHFRLAARYAPEDPKAVNNLASALAKLGRRDEAETLFERAIGLDADYAEPRHNLGILLFAKGETERAIAQLAKAVEIEPGRAETYRALGAMFLAQNRTAEAVRSYGQALRILESRTGREAAAPEAAAQAAAASEVRKRIEVLKSQSAH